MAASITPSARARAADPAHWQEDWLGRRLWDVQASIARAVAAHDSVAVKGCHASGKSFLAAGMPLRHLARYRNAVCFTTSPTQRQIKVFWKEVHAAWQDGKVRHMLPEPLTQTMEVSDRCYALGASSSAGVKIQGPHAEHLLIIADEAPGIEPDVWDAIAGMSAGGDVHQLAMGNPVVPSGKFFDMFTKERAAHRLFSISAFDTPNLAGVQMTVPGPDGRPVTYGSGKELMDGPWGPGLTADELAVAQFPGLTTRSWVRNRALAWGVGHPKFQSRVLAEFPSQSPYSVFDLAWIERAKRDATPQEIKFAQDRGAVIQCGLDVAGPGDDETVLTARVNGMILGQWAWHEADPRHAVMRQIGDLRARRDYRLGQIVVDITGIGYHFATWLADQGCQVFGFNAGSSPIDATQFYNLKSEAYFQARGYFREGLVSGLADEECEAQLSTLQYAETDRGLTRIESKDDARKRGVQSPDRAESLILSLLKIVPRQQHVEEQWHRVRISSV